VKLSDKIPANTTPDDVLGYLSSDEAKKAGWVVWDTWNVELPLKK
jgi:hypothetical protein